MEKIITKIADFRVKIDEKLIHKVNILILLILIIAFIVR